MYAHTGTIGLQAGEHVRVKSAINLLAVCASGAYCLHRALRHFSQGGQHQSASLISEQS